MQIRRHTLAALSAASLAAAGALAPSALGTAAAPTHQRQQRELDRACLATGTSVAKAVKAAASGSVPAIQSQFRVLTPGALTGKIAFNLNGKSISLGAGDPTGAATQGSFGCGEATASGARVSPSPSRVVSTLHRRFTKPGRYTLTFALNRAGRNMIAQLTALDRAYRTKHPHGKRPPALAYGVTLEYAPAR